MAAAREDTELQNCSMGILLFHPPLALNASEVDFYFAFILL